MAFSTVSASDNRVYLSTLAGDIYTWDMSSNQFAYQASTGVQLTDIAIAPDGRLFGISYTGLYQIDPQTGQTVYVGPLSSPTQLYYGFSAMTSANGFDISPDGTARVSSGNSVWVFEVDLATGQISAPYAQSLGYRTSAGDIWFIDDTTYAVSTNSYTVEYIAPGSFSEYSVQSDWVGANDLWALFQAPANSTVVAPGTMVGIAASNDTAYNVDAGNFVLGPGLATFTLGWGQDISGAAVHHGATGSVVGGTGGGGGTFDLLDAARLAHAAYALNGNNFTFNTAANNKANSNSYLTWSELKDDEGFDFSTFGTLQGNVTSSRGQFVEQNAGAIVATKGKDLFVAFTGTNDLVLNSNTGSTLDTMGKALAGAGSLLATRDSNSLSTLGSGIKLIGKFIDTFTLKFGTLADHVDWFNRGGHWQKFDRLYQQIADYVQDGNVDNIYVTGHSLGAGMVPYFIKQLDDDGISASVGVEGITFATPGNKFVLRRDVLDDDDPRITNYWTNGDIIQLASTLSDNPGETNKFYTGIKSLILYDNPLGMHDMDVYLTAVRFLDTIGLGNPDFAGKSGTTLKFNLDNSIFSLKDFGPTIGLDDVGQAMNSFLMGAAVSLASNDSTVIVGTDQKDNIWGSPLSGLVFAGMGGDDIITATKGHSDVFIFRPGDGHDVLDKFDIDEDKLDLRAYDRDGTPVVVTDDSQNSNDLTLMFDGTDTVTLLGVDPSNFAIYDSFVFL